MDYLLDINRLTLITLFLIFVVRRVGNTVASPLFRIAMTQPWPMTASSLCTLQVAFESFVYTFVAYGNLLEWESLSVNRKP